MKIKVRKTWGILNPNTKVIPDKTKYNRARRKIGLWLLTKEND